MGIGGYLNREFFEVCDRVEWVGGLDGEGLEVTFAFKETCDFAELVSGEILAAASMSPQRMAMVWYSTKKKKKRVRE